MQAVLLGSGGQELCPLPHHSQEWLGHWQAVATVLRFEPDDRAEHACRRGSSDVICFATAAMLDRLSVVYKTRAEMCIAASWLSDGNRAAQAALNSIRLQGPQTENGHGQYALAVGGLITTATEQRVGAAKVGRAGC